MATFDVVVIGSGAGGLAAAVALANAGKQVMVLEQHYMAGGWTHSFVLEGHKFSPGVHYVGKLGPDETFSQLYQGLGVSGDLEFCKLNEEGFEHVIVGEERFDIPAGRERFCARLQERFPAEREGIARFFRLMTQLAEQSLAYSRYKRGWRKLLVPFVLPQLFRHRESTMEQILASTVKDPLLRTILMAQAGDYALPPSQTTALTHALLMEHYFDGGYYPRGGGHRIPRAFVRQLKRKGGQIRLRARVEKILLRDGRAVGVRLSDGEELHATHIISNADPHMTFTTLVGHAHLSESLRQTLAQTTYSASTVSLFLATNLDLKAMGYDSGNYWYYARPDLESIYAMDTQSIERFEGLFLTIPTLKDPSKAKDGHTVEVFGFAPYEPFSQWEGHESGTENEDYAAFKEACKDKLLAAAEHVLPGLRESLTFCEVGTPLTNAYYCAGHRGAIYGTNKAKGADGAFPFRTEIPGLWMVGASTRLGHGVLPATASGVYAACKILQRSMKDVLCEQGPPVELYAAEAPETWLDKLAQKRNAQAKRPRTPTPAAPAPQDNERPRP